MVEDHRKAIEEFEEEPVSQDMMTAQSGLLEQYQWFVRAHLEDGTGRLVNEGATSEGEAAAMASATPGTSVEDVPAGADGQATKRRARRKAAAKS